MNAKFPIEIARMEKNKRNKECVLVSLTEYEGRKIINVRVYIKGPDDIDHPTQKGIAMAVQRLPELAIAINKALLRAQQLGLLDEEEVSR